MSLRPALIIALGGTGTNVVRNVLRYLGMRYGDSNFDHVRYLFVDTDLNNPALKGFKNQSGELLDPWLKDLNATNFQLSVSSDRIDELMSPNADIVAELALNDWFDPQLRGMLTKQNFQTGVGGVRMYGRMAFLASSNLSEIRDQIDEDLKILRRGDNFDNTHSAALKVIVVASAGGGTGSGTFLDMGYLLRMILQNLNTASGVCDIEGISAIAVSNTFPDPKRARNSAAMLQELDHFCQPYNIFKANYVGDALPVNLGKEAPYDFITLVSPTQGDQILADDAAEAMIKLEDKIGQYIFLRLTDPGGTNGIGARVRDMQTAYSNYPNDLKGYPNRFMTFGVALREYPTGHSQKISYRMLLSRLLVTWLKTEQSGELFLADTELSANSALKARYDTDLSRLRDQMGLLEPHHYGSDGKSAPERNHGEDKLCLQLLDTHGGQSVISVLTTAVRNRKVEEMFRYAGPSQPLVAGQEGYVAGTITTNKDRLISGETGHLNTIYTIIWEAAFDKSRGPRYALRLIKDLNFEIQRDRDFIKETLLDTAVNANGSSPHLVANQLAKRHLVQAKSEVFASVQTKLVKSQDSVNTRLELLLEYLESWRKQEFAAAGSIETTHTLQESLEQEIVRIEPGINPNTFDLLKARAMEGQDFYGELPRKGGGIDYTPFEQIKSRIGQSLDPAQKTADRSHQSATALGMMAKANAGDWKRECEELVSESRPLLNLRLDASGYGVLLERSTFLEKTSAWFGMVSKSAEMGNTDNYDAFLAALQRAANDNLKAKLRIRSLQFVEDHQDSSVVGLVFLRTTFPSRIIAQYEHGEQREKLIYPPHAPGTTTAYTQTGITIPVEPQVRERAIRLLLIGEALRARPNQAFAGPKIDWGKGLNNRSHSYQYKQPGEMQPVTVLYPNTFEGAISQLVHNSGALNQLEAELDGIVADENTHGDLLRIFDVHLLALTELTGRNEWRGRYIQMDLGDLEYKVAIRYIKSWMRDKGIRLSDEGATHPWATFNVADGVWYCKNPQTRDVVGGSKNEVPPEDGFCPHCKWGK